MNLTCCHVGMKILQTSANIYQMEILLSQSCLLLQNKKSSSSTATGLKNRVHGLVPKVKNEVFWAALFISSSFCSDQWHWFSLNVQVKTKVQKLKDTRDYSFLLTDDAELPAPTKEPAPRNVSAPNSGNCFCSWSGYSGLVYMLFLLRKLIQVFCWCSRGEICSSSTKDQTSFQQ